MVVAAEHRFSARRSPDHESLDQVELQDVDAEQALLSCVLFQAEILDELDHIAPEAFYVSKHGILFEVMRSMWAKGVKPDLISLSSELQRQGKLEVIGGKLFLSGLMSNHMSSAHVLDYAKTVSDKYIGRQMMKAGRQLVDLATDETLSVEERLDRAQEMVYRLGDTEQVNHAIASPDACIQLMEMLESGKAKKIKGSGFDELFSYTGGIAPGQLHVAIGQTGMAKSHFGVAMAMSYAPKHPVFCLTVEMDEIEYMSRIVARLSGVDSGKIQRNEVDVEDMSRVVEAMERVSSLKLHIYAHSGPSDAQIRSELRRMARYWGETPKLVVVDYLQYFDLKGTRNRVEELDRITKNFKAIAKDFDCTVLLLSQAKREVDDRGDKRPKKTDSRECGAIENHANLIYGLYRDEEARRGADDVETGTIEISLLKGRDFKLPYHPIKMNFEPSISYFSSIHDY